MILLVSRPDDRPVTDETGAAIGHSLEGERAAPAVAGAALPRGGASCCVVRCCVLRPVLLGSRLLYLSYCRSFRTLCGTWLAWASMAVPAWFMIWSRGKFTISMLMWVSRTRDSDDERFSAATDRVAPMWSRRVCGVARGEPAVGRLAMAESSRAVAA